MIFSMKLPQFLHAATWGVLVSLPVLFLGLAASGALSKSALLESYPGVVVGAEMSDSLFFGALVVGLLPWGAIAYALWQAIRLFALFSEGRALTLQSASRIRKIGVGLIFLAAFQIIAHTLQVLVLSSGNPPGQRMLSIQVGTPEVGLLLAAGLMTVIGQSMLDAARTRAELSEFV